MLRDLRHEQNVSFIHDTVFQSPHQFRVHEFASEDEKIRTDAAVEHVRWNVALLSQANVGCEVSIFWLRELADNKVNQTVHSSVVSLCEE